MTTATYLVGDVFDRLAEIPDGSIDLVMTSPPFLALRSYLPADHPDKGKEIGSEPTPAAFLDTMLALTTEWGRVLAPHGSICVELGDTYAGSGGAGGDYNPDGLRDGQERFDGSSRRGRNRVADDGRPTTGPDRGSGNGIPSFGVKTVAARGEGWPLDKSLCGIPTLYAWSLAYGRNLLTGAESPAGRWRVRNLVAWVRPNPPVGALGDKFRPATSYLTIATRARDRYFDLDAVRTAIAGSTADRHRYPNLDMRRKDKRDGGGSAHGMMPDNVASNPAGAPPLDWWNIPPSGYPGAHYAVYPPELCTRPILTMTPRRVCTTCGEPSRRIVEADPDAEKRTISEATEAIERDRMNEWQTNRGNGQYQMPRDRAGERTVRRAVITTGWSDCGHGTWRPGHVLDPFAGTGTTLAVATGHGREATGIDLDYTNAGLALDRIGPLFLDIDWPPGDLTLPALPASSGHQIGATDQQIERLLEALTLTFVNTGQRQPVVAAATPRRNGRQPVHMDGQLDLITIDHGTQQEPA